MSRVSAITVAAFGAVFFSGTAFATVVYENALPVANVNSPTVLRSNIAFSETDPTTTFDGTDVTLSSGLLGASYYDLTSVTTWSIASDLGQPLGDEFSDIALYYRAAGGTWQILEEGTPDQFFQGSSNVDANSNPDITSTNVNYTALHHDYESTTTPGSYFPLWQNTFNISSLNLVLQVGVDYQFAVWGVGINPDPSTGFGYWYNSYSNAFLSGPVREDGTSGTYLRCSFSDLSLPCQSEAPGTDGSWDKGANMNIEIDGTAAQVTPTPEGSSFTLISVGLLGLGWLSRKRLKC